MDILKAYAMFLARKNSDNTIKSYLYDINLFLDYIKEKKDLENNMDCVKNTTIEDVEDYLNNCKSNKDTLYRVSSINRKIISLKGFYEYCKVNRKNIEHNPFDGQVMFMEQKTRKKSAYIQSRPEKTQREILTLEEFSRIIREMDIRHKGERNFEFNSARNKFLFSLLFTTGLRIDECLEITLSDIEKTEYGYMINIPYTKTGVSKRIPISGVVENYYKDYMYVRPWRQTDILFLSSNRKKLALQNTLDILSKYTKMCNIDKHITNHSLRHSFRTIITGRGVNENLIRLIGGWATDSISGIYVHDDKSLDREKINACNFLETVVQ